MKSTKNTSVKSQIPAKEPMSLNELIDFALTNPQGDDLYDAYERATYTAMNDDLTIRDVRTLAVLDVIKTLLVLGGRPLTGDERGILEGLRTHN